MQNYTELEAVNEILELTNELSVSSLTDIEGNNAAETALNTLRRVSKEVQSRGCPECVEKQYPIVLDASGYLNIPSTALSADVNDRRVETYAKDDKLYDVYNHTYNWTTRYSAGASVKVDIIWHRSFSDLQQATQRFIVMKAAAELHIKLVGDSESLNQLMMLKREAEKAYTAYQIRTTECNYLNDPLSRSRLNRRANSRMTTQGW